MAAHPVGRAACAEAEDPRGQIHREEAVHPAEEQEVQAPRAAPQAHGGWGYRSTVDSTIKQAYLIPRSWRRNCLKGECPRVRRRFVRIKETLYVLRDRKLRITLEPRKRYL